VTVATPTCTTVPAAPSPIRIRFPGGITLEGIPSLEGGTITDLGSVQALLAAATPALAGLQPVFLIIDAVTKTVAVIQSVPGLIGGNVVDFFDTLGEAVQAVAALAQLQPALSLPLLLSDLISALTTTLRALRTEVTELAAISAQADALIASADPNLVIEGNCYKAQAEAYGEHVIASLGPLGKLMDTATQLAGLMPSPPALPSIGEATGLDLDELGTFLDTLISTFEAVSIPGA
jgi:hypothetical protein